MAKCVHRGRCVEGRSSWAPRTPPCASACAWASGLPPRAAAAPNRRSPASSPALSPSCSCPAHRPLTASPAPGSAPAPPAAAALARAGSPPQPRPPASAPVRSELGAQRAAQWECSRPQDQQLTSCGSPSGDCSPSGSGRAASEVSGTPAGRRVRSGEVSGGSECIWGPCLRLCSRWAIKRRFLYVNQAPSVPTLTAAVVAVFGASRLASQLLARPRQRVGGCCLPAGSTEPGRYACRSWAI